MSEDGIYITITFPEELLYFFKESRMKYKFVWPYTRLDSLRVYEIKNQPQIIQCLKKIFEIYQESTEYKEYDISICITSAWRLLLECFGKEKFVSNKKDIEKQERVQVMLVFIHTHYSEDISLVDIANAGMISIAQCNRCFKQMLNITPYEYLIQYRLTKSMSLLQDATLNITEISDQVGFNNVTHFIQAFKKKYGISPKKYRTEDHLL